MPTYGRKDAPLGNPEPKWESISADILRKMSSRWSYLERAEIKSAVGVALATCIKKFQSGENIQNLPGMMWDIAFRTLNNEHRRAYKTREVGYNDVEHTDKKHTTSPHELLEEKQLYAALDELIAQLPDHKRIPLVAHFIKGMPYSEIQKMTGIPAGTARNNVCKAKGEIRAKMEASGH